MTANIGNRCRAGTRFHFRTGETLGAQSAETAIVFRDLPRVIPLPLGDVVTLRGGIMQPDPGGFRLTEVSRDMAFVEAPAKHAPSQDADEGLVMGVIRGQRTLFLRGQEVWAAWPVPVIAGWKESWPVPALSDQGWSGQDDALMWLHHDGGR